MAFVLAAGSSHSFNRSLGRSFLATPLTNSFVHLASFSPHGCVFRASTPALSPTHANSISAYFYLRIVCPIKPVPDHGRFVQPSLIVSSCYWNENNCPRLFRFQLFPNFNSISSPYPIFDISIFVEIWGIQRLIDVNRSDRMELHFNSAFFIKTCTHSVHNIFCRK